MQAIFSRARFPVSGKSAFWNGHRALHRIPGRRYYSEKPEPGPDPNEVYLNTKNLESKMYIGPFNWVAGLVFCVTGGGIYYYFTSEKKRVMHQREEAMGNVKRGRPLIGGPFTLATHTGGTFSDKDLKNRWSLIYFGFTNCPDICPDELDRMGKIVGDITREKHEEIQPIFVTCDPARDNAATIAHYLKDFSPKFVGLTGTYDQIKAMCKTYRVYFSAPPNLRPGDDYLVDHSIFFYLMDPNGQFVDAFGRSVHTDVVEAKISAYLDEWRQNGKGSWTDQVSVADK